MRVKTFYHLTLPYLSRLPLVLSHFVPFVDHAGTSGSPAPFALVLAVSSAHHPPPPIVQVPSPMSLCLSRYSPSLCILLTDVYSFYSPEARGPGCSPLLSGHPVPGLQCWRSTNVCWNKARGGAPKSKPLTWQFCRETWTVTSRHSSRFRAARPSLADGLPRGVLVWFSSGRPCLCHSPGDPVARAAPGLWQPR